MPTAKKPRRQQFDPRFSFDRWDLLPLGMPDEMRDGKPWGKVPRDGEWTTRAYDSAVVWAECIKDGRNLGVRPKPSQLIVDVDPRNGGDESFERLCADVGLRPEHYPCVLTGGGGRHYYMTKPPGVPVRGKAKGYPGLDFVSVGRQVVIPPSLHPTTGNRYEWDVFGPHIRDILPCPEPLLRLIHKPVAGPVSAGTVPMREIRRILASLSVLDFRDHDDWLALMMGIHHASGGAARQEFIVWSIGDPKYAGHAQIIGERWDTLDANPSNARTVGTVNFYLGRFGKLKFRTKERRAAAALDDFRKQIGCVNV